jgi:hypothetical protein
VLCSQTTQIRFPEYHHIMCMWLIHGAHYVHETQNLPSVKLTFSRWTQRTGNGNFRTRANVSIVVNVLRHLLRSASKACCFGWSCKGTFKIPVHGSVSFQKQKPTWWHRFICNYSVTCTKCLEISKGFWQCQSTVRSKRLPGLPAEMGPLSN